MTNKKNNEVNYSGHKLSPPCMVILEIIPDVRCYLSIKLKNSNMSQEKIANILGITQASVSNYIKSNCKTFSSDVKSLGDSVFAAIVSSENSNVNEPFCRTCERLFSSGVMCERHSIDDCTFCFQEQTPEKETVIDNLISSLSMLKGIKIGVFSPEIGINIAMSQKDSCGFGDIASFPGRIRTHDGKIIGNYTPEFGASRHMASIILAIDKRAVINLKYVDEVKSYLLSSGKTYFINRVDGRDAGDILREIKNIRQESDINNSISIKDVSFIVDEGWIGIEPCVYVTGDNAVESALLAMEIIKKYYDSKK